MSSGILSVLGFQSASITTQASPVIQGSLHGDRHTINNLWVDLMFAGINKPASIVALEKEIGYTATISDWRQIFDDWFSYRHKDSA
tara:strand:+ start:457 stop:714 length:258 start_codon:yes stop_codon:yes gene_type:complete